MPLLRDAAAGRSFIDPEIEARVQEVRHKDEQSPMAMLEPNEPAVARMLAQGLTNEQIASRMGFRDKRTISRTNGQIYAVWGLDVNATDEKVAQLQCMMKDVEKGDLIGEQGLGGIGPIMRSLSETQAAAKANRIHKLVQCTTRLGIPPILHDEGLHGVIGAGATSFPQAIALAATWDPELVQSVATAIGKESRARGIRQLLSPVINVARDVRWGRPPPCCSAATRPAPGAVWD